MQIYKSLISKSHLKVKWIVMIFYIFLRILVVNNLHASAGENLISYKSGTNDYSVEL